MENMRKTKKGKVSKQKHKLSEKGHDSSQSRSIEAESTRPGRGHRHASSNFHQRNLEIVGFSNFFPEEEPQCKASELYTPEKEMPSPATKLEDNPEYTPGQFLSEMSAQMELIKQRDQEHLRLVTQKKKAIKTELYQSFFGQTEAEKEPDMVYNSVRRSLMKLGSYSNGAKSANNHR